MISFFRRIFSSKIGLAITIAFIALIALAFASADVSGTGTFGGISGSDSVAVVGDEKIGTAEFARTANSAVEQIRQNSPTITMRAFVEQDGLDDVLDQLVDRYVLAGYAKMYGMRAGDNLVNSQIMTLPAFQGPDGNFSQDSYEQFLVQRNLTDALVRADLQQGLLSEQITLSAVRGARLPKKFAKHYGGLLSESRKGAIAFLPSAAFAPKGDPTDKQLKAFYEEEKAQFVRPERRTVRFTTFGIDNVSDRVTPTDAEIAARFEKDKTEYGASQSRSFTRLIVPTQDAANSIKSRIEDGEDFDKVASDLGFSSSKIESTDKSAYAGATSTAVAEAAFEAARGKVAAPVRGSLGWHVTRVDTVNDRAARTLADVKSELSKTMGEEMRIAALSDLSAQIEEEVDGGAPLSKVAENLGVKITTTKELTADGRVYGTAQETAPQELAGALQTAFDMDEGEPQLVEITRGETFLVFEVGEITQSATAPMDDIKKELTAAWKQYEGAKLAKEASDRILKRMAEGGTLAAAVSAEETRLPPAENVNLNRREIVSQDRQVPPPLALLFSMAIDTTKRLEMANKGGWFVVDLDEINAQSIDDNEELLAATGQQLQGALVAEYSAQLTAAMREEIGVERNDNAIDAVRKQLLGET
ncbi:MAG: SurA N-terminal domain-containing protein [Erythrobacter sp.]